MTAPRRFSVGGPFLVPTKGETRAKALDRDSCDEFWDNEAYGWEDSRGCYVFALRRGKGYVPIYVGKTSRSFHSECFTDRNYRLLHEAMDGESGTLVVFLLAYEESRGALNGTALSALEKYLVE